jgi:hypothetical protein
MRRYEVGRNRNRHGNRGADRDHPAHEQQRFAQRVRAGNVDSILR